MFYLCFGFVDRTDPLTGFFGAANRIAALRLVSAQSETCFNGCHSNFSSGSTSLEASLQFQRAESDEKYHRVENHADNMTNQPGTKSDLCTVDKFSRFGAGKRMNINFKRPAQGKQNKNPHIIAPQSPADRFPFADREMRRNQIGGNMFRPFLVRRNRAVRQHRRKISCFQNSDAICPNFVISVTARFHKQKNRDQNRIYRNRKMRIVRRTENE